MIYSYRRSIAPQADLSCVPPLLLWMSSILADQQCLYIAFPAEKKKLKGNKKERRIDSP